MSYQQLVTNDAGEPLGIETLYDDESAYWDGHDFGEFYDSPFDDDQDPDTTQDGFPHENRSRGRVAITKINGSGAL